MSSAKPILSPPFWDFHIHGAFGVDFLTGSKDHFQFACTELGRRGIGAFLPTFVSAPWPQLDRALDQWAPLVRMARQDRIFSGGARPIGIHLEGPFLSSKQAGAHSIRHLKKINRTHLTSFDRLLDRHPGIVRIVTVAPELAGLSDLIRLLRSHNIRVQLGHSVADATAALQAVRLGASGLTHVCNAMPMHHRAPGLMNALFYSWVTAEIITDGVHVDPTFLWMLHSAFPSSLYAVSDACAVAHARSKKAEPFTLGAVQIEKVSLPGERAAAFCSQAGRRSTELRLAGAATLLTEHPAILWKALEKLPSFTGTTQRTFFSTIESLFGKRQRTLAKTWGIHLARSSWHNLFSASDLRFLGTKGRQS